VLEGPAGVTTAPKHLGELAMPALTAYRLRPRVNGLVVSAPDAYIDFEGKSIHTAGPIEGPGFSAKAYVTEIPPHPPRWGSFLKQGFGDEFAVPLISAAGAVLVVTVQIAKKTHFYGFAFGVSGRFLLKQGAIEAAFGVRTALNLLYPTDAADADQARLLGMDAKRHGHQTVRSRLQASRATTPEAFDLDELRDILNAATGRPMNKEKWGTRLSGGDGLSLNAPVDFDELGRLCKELHAVHARSDYRTRFPWLDHISPVSDPEVADKLDSAVIDLLIKKQGDFDLAPPEIVDWPQIDDFRYSTDRKNRHPELRLQDLLATLKMELDTLTVQRLRTIRIRALNPDGSVIHDWRAWACLTGSFQIEDRTYVLDEGQYFVVAGDFLQEVNEFIDSIQPGPPLPPFTIEDQDETAYNAKVADALDGAIMMHEQLIETPQRGSRVELCDVLTPEKQLIHVKRELGSRDLSHLLAQGFGAAEFVQQDRHFRRAIREKLESLSPGTTLGELFPEKGVTTADFEVVFAVAADWRGRKPSQALSFFGKVNLRRVARDLRSRGYRCAWTSIDGPSAAAKKAAKAT
jgi:uncharacterized protein (TIGR04141 family)